MWIDSHDPGIERRPRRRRPSRLDLLHQRLAELPSSVMLRAWQIEDTEQPITAETAISRAIAEYEVAR